MLLRHNYNKMTGLLFAKFYSSIVNILQLYIYDYTFYIQLRIYSLIIIEIFHFFRLTLLDSHIENV